MPRHLRVEVQWGPKKTTLPFEVDDGKSMKELVLLVAEELGQPPRQLKDFRFYWQNRALTWHARLGDLPAKEPDVALILRPSPGKKPPAMLPPRPKAAPENRSAAKKARPGEDTVQLEEGATTESPSGRTPVPAQPSKEEAASVLDDVLGVPAVDEASVLEAAPERTEAVEAAGFEELWGGGKAATEEAPEVPAEEVAAAVAQTQKVSPEEVEAVEAAVDYVGGGEVSSEEAIVNDADAVAVAEEQTVRTSKSAKALRRPAVRGATVRRRPLVTFYRRMLGGYGIMLVLLYLLTLLYGGVNGVWTGLLGIVLFLVVVGFALLSKQKSYPLVVRLDDEGGGRAASPGMEGPTITVQPVIPGCLVTPATAEVPTAAGSEARFSVLPLCRGKIKDARIEFHDQGRALPSVPLTMKSGTRMLAWFLFFLAIAIPWGLGSIRAGLYDPSNMNVRGDARNAYRNWMKEQAKDIKYRQEVQEPATAADVFYGALVNDKLEVFGASVEYAGFRDLQLEIYEDYIYDYLVTVNNLEIITGIALLVLALIVWILQGSARGRRRGGVLEVSG